MKLLTSVLLLLAIVACGQPLSTTVPIEGTPVVPRNVFQQSELDTIPSPADNSVPTSAPAADTPPGEQLPEGTLATFDPNVAETLDVGGRYYTLGECVAYSCHVTLWPDNTQVWIRREALGLEKYVLPPITVYRAYTPTPAPRSFSCGPNNEMTVYGYSNLEQRCLEEYLATYGGNRAELNSPSPQPMP